MGSFNQIFLLLLVAFWLIQALQWARLIQWRKHILYPTTILLWSLFWCGRLPFITLPSAQQAWAVPVLFLYIMVGLLLFPAFHRVDYKDRYAYIDVYEQLRKQRFWVFGLALLAELILFYLSLSSDLSFEANNWWIILLLFFSICTEHKGLMLVWVWSSFIGLYYLEFR